jgi:uncharacterized protein (TIGR03435 family)
MIKQWIVAVAICALPSAGGSRLSAQTEFEVASVKEDKEFSYGGTTEMRPSVVRAQHVDAWSLVTIAYRVEPYQLLGGPGWTRSTYYDINAKPGISNATQDQLFAMLQQLLQDRFKLVTHHETRQFDGFALVREPSGKLGPGLRVPEIDCRPNCRNRIGIGLITGNGIGMEDIRRVILNAVNAPVSDETQLSGLFEVDLRWSNALSTSADNSGSIFTAIQEQLGLKLERRRVDVDVIVIDHIEHPTPD